MNKYCHRFELMKITPKLLLFLLFPLTAIAQTRQRPNIVFILADDLGYGDVGVYGQQKILTPNIDQLAKEGTKFTDFYAGAPVCSPSRGVLLTGKNMGHATIRGNMTIKGGIPGGKAGKQVYRAGLNPDEQTIGNVLRNAGYTTGLVGKWHVDGFDTTATPLAHGFDYFYGWLVAYPQTYVSTYWPDVWYRNGKMEDIPQNKNGQQKYYTSEIITDDAIKFMGTHKNDKKPFFVMVNHSNPHSPLDAPHNTIYENKDWTADQKTYAAMVTYLDRSVGKIKEYLVANGLNKNTIVIFTSDNGPRSEPTRQLTDVSNFFQSYGLLRGYKRDVTEGGIREPFIVWGKGHIKPGTVSHSQGYFADMMATCAGIAQTKLTLKTDGINMYPYFLNPQATPKGRFLYWEFFEGGYVQAVRYGQWKAINRDGKLSLYDLSKDIHEDHDLADAQPAMVQKIRNYLLTSRTPSPYWPVTGER
jgi:arylsulfatase A-like enzyme